MTNLLPVNTNRYQQLLASLPRGSFYNAVGYIIPYRSGVQQFRLETATPSRAFGLFVNDVFAGTVQSDNAGIVILSLTVPPGKTTIKIVDGVTQQPFLSYIDARRFADWYASYADILETSDAEIEDIYNARSLNTVTANYAEAVYGLPLSTPNVADYSIVSYVNVLQELRQSYRGYGGMPRGLRAGVGAFLSSSPLDVPKAWIPAWILGQDLLPNSNLQAIARTSIAQESVAGVDLPTINQVSLTYIHGSILDNAGALNYAPTHQPPVAQQLTVTTDTAWAGGNITITGTDATGQLISETVTPVVSNTVETVLDFATVTSIAKASVGGAGHFVKIGTALSRYVTILSMGPYNALGSALPLEWRNTPSLQWATGTSIYPINPVSNPGGIYTLTGLDKAAEIYGLPVSTYNLDPLGTGANTSAHIDQLYISANFGQTLLVDLSALAPATAVTAAQIVTAINAVFSGMANAVVGTEGQNGTIVHVSAFSGTGPTSQVRLDPGAGDAARIIFGLPIEHTTLASPAAIGDGTITVVDATVFPTVQASPKLARFLVGAASNIKGVAFGDPSAATALGQGSLKLIITTSTNKTLQYASPGDGFGAAVQVGAGGAFVLVSTNGIDTLPVTVDAATLNASTVAQTLTDIVELYVPGEFQIRMRGRRAAGTDGQITATGSGTTATFASATTIFSALDIGGGIRVVSGNLGNQGGVAGHNLVHTITAFNSIHSVTILNAGPAGTVFVSEGPGDTFSLFSPGETHVITKVTGNVLSLRDAVTNTWLGNIGVSVDRTNEIPVSSVGKLGPDTLTVKVDPTFAPGVGGPLTDNVTPTGVYVPDGWHTANVTSSTTQLEPGQMGTGVLVLRSTATADVSLFRSIPGALDYIGLPLRASFWVQEHSAASANYRIDVSIDGGATWLLGTPQAVTGTIKHIFGSGIAAGPNNPVAVRRTFFLPTTATSAWIRLTRISAGENPLTFTVARAMIDSPTHTATFLGLNTIPRNAQRSNFRELIYLWSPEALTADEDAIIGVNPGNDPPYTTKPGHVDLLMPAHESVERFDVSEYDPATFLPINLAGVYTDIDWTTNATLTNMEVVVGTPSRLTYARPTRVSQVPSELLAFTATGGGVNSTVLSEPTAFLGATPPGTPDGDALLLSTATTYLQKLNGVTLQSPTNPGDIIVVPDTPDAASVQPWKWIAGNKIFVDNAYFDSSATYYLTYNALMRAETGTITLPASQTDYVWLVDVGYFTRVDLTEGSESLTEQMTFRADFTAALSSQSDENLATSILIADNGVIRTTVAQANWSYLDAQTIRINPSVFDTASLYSFSYNALYPQLEPPASLTIEWRSATTAIGLASATYLPVQNGEPVNPVDIAGAYNQFHQLRITISGIVDVRDIRLYGVGLKGIHMFGASPRAPGIVVSG